MDQGPLDRRTAEQAQTRKLISLLVLGSVVAAAVIAWMLVLALGAPLILGVAVAVFFLCLDAIAITIVWYGSKRR